MQSRSCLVLAAMLLAAPAVRAAVIPTFDEVRALYRPSETLVLSREGQVIQRVRTDPVVRRGQWVPLTEISAALRTALVLSEDKRFYEHSGVDWTAVSAAAWGNLWHGRTRGASTLTMQLAGLLSEADSGFIRTSSGRRTVAEKMGQAVVARVLDRRWHKDQILEAYLNLVPLRGEIVGIDALARTLFHKAAHGLDEREAAVTVALVRAPNASAAAVARRACGVLGKMQQQTAQTKPVVDCMALEFFTTSALGRRAFAVTEGIAPHLARQLLRRSPAFEAASTDADRRNTGGGSSMLLTSTLNAALQRAAVDILGYHLRELSGHHVHDGALVVLDNASGEVLAWVGSSGPLSQASEVDAVMALRQPGSTLKAFLYAQAIAEKRLTAASLIEDAPTHINTGSGLYIPQNYDRQFRGWVSVRTALAASFNVPAVRTLVMVTPEAFAAQLRMLGLPLAESGDWYGYSLALGSSEMPLLDLTNAYRALANGGCLGPVRFWGHGALSPPTPTARTDCARVLDAGAAFIVGDILSDANARARTFGSDSVLSTRFWTAVKTGTSKDMRDNWAIGWSQRYTVGVWVGNANGDAMHDVSGTSGAAPIWADVMNWLHRDTPSHPPAPPQGVVAQSVRYGPAPDGRWLEAARQEWFLRGTQQALFVMEQAGVGAQAPHTTARILAPAPGTIVALDPDIPPKHQRLQFRASSAAVRWRITGQLDAQKSHDGERSSSQGSGAQWAWPPWPGRHRVELLDTEGRVLEHMDIEVRGAGVRAK